MGAVEVRKILNLVSDLLDVPYSRIWTAYDEEADVLYINFKKPSRADDSELTADDVILRYEKGELVGITVLNASKRKIKNATTSNGVYPFSSFPKLRELRALFEYQVKTAAK